MPLAKVLIAMLVALPPKSGTGAPWLAPSIWNCTVPPAAPGLISAVKEIGWPKLDGFADEKSPTEVTALLTAPLKLTVRVTRTGSMIGTLRLPL